MELMSLMLLFATVLKRAGEYTWFLWLELEPFSTRETDGECNFKGEGLSKPQLPELPPSAESSRLV